MNREVILTDEEAASLYAEGGDALVIWAAQARVDEALVGLVVKGLIEFVGFDPFTGYPVFGAERVVFDRAD